MTRLPQFEEDLLRAGDGWHRPRARARRAARSAAPVVATAAVLLVAVLVGLGLARDDTETAAPAGRDTFVYEIPTETMRPTFRAGQEVTVDRDAYVRNAPAVGDVVLVHPPAGADASACAAPATGSICPRPTGRASDLVFLERVVAGPGDVVALQDGRLLRDGRTTYEPFALPCRVPSCTLRTPITVPDGAYLLLGDNRGVANDSRYWGPLPVDWIVGRVQE